MEGVKGRCIDMLGVVEKEGVEDASMVTIGVE